MRIQKFAVLTILFALFMIITVNDLHAAKTDPVATKQGLIRGKLMDGKSVAHFMGVPFAKPPIGDLRWKAPEPAEPWDGVHDAFKFSPWCSQNHEKSDEYMRVFGKGMGHGWLRRFVVNTAMKVMPAAKVSEDCLYLNIRTGNLNGEEKQPVMVWIHGGAYQYGSGDDMMAQTNALVKRGIVQVSINYRLGILGFFAHPVLSEESEHGVSGNYGLLDQIAALEWIRENIEVFGGDPNNVTIFGESSGGASVANLMSSPLAEGLFHRAIIQSTGPEGFMLGLESSSGDLLSAHDAGVNFTQGLEIDSDKVSAEELRAIPIDSLLQHISATRDEYAYKYLYPIIDGYVLPKNAAQTFRDSLQSRVPLLIGYNGDEGSLFYHDKQSPSTWEFNAPKEYGEFVKFLEKHYGEDSKELIKLYGFDNPETRMQGEIDMGGDEENGVFARFFAGQMDKIGVSSYLYHFTRVAPSKKQTLGAYHFADVPFVFDSHNFFFTANSDDEELTKAMGDYWTNFAKTGNPNGNGLVEWSDYNTENGKWINLNHKIESEKVSRKTKLDILEKTMLKKMCDTSPIIESNILKIK